MLISIIIKQMYISVNLFSLTVYYVYKVSEQMFQKRIKEKEI